MIEPQDGSLCLLTLCGSLDFDIHLTFPRKKGVGSQQ